MSRAVDSGGLTEQQDKFCREYIKDFNGSRAAVAAGYSPKTAFVQASQLLSRLNIQARVSELNQEVHKADIMDVQEIRERLTRMARGEIDEETVVVEGTGQGFSKARVVTKKITPKDQAKALELLGKASGMFIDKIQATVDDGLAVAKQYLESAKDGKFTKS